MLGNALLQIARPWLAIGFAAGVIAARPVSAEEQIPPAAQPQEQDSQSNVDAAAEALRGGQPVLAEQLSSRVILAPYPQPKDLADAFITRGLAREQLGRPYEAVADFTQAIDSKALALGDLARAYFDRGVTHDGMNQIPDAISDYTEALKLEPRFPAALNNRANAYRRTGQLAEAKADYEASLSAGNSSPEYPYYGLGQVAEASGDVDAAVNYYRKALHANPNYELPSKRLLELGHPWTNDTATSRPAKEKLAFVSKPVTLKKPKTAEDSSNSANPSLRPAIAEAAAAPDNAETSAKPSRAKPSLVQLGSFRSEDTARAAWQKFASIASDQLKELSPQIVAADLPGRGRWYRLRTGPVSAAAALCGKLKTQGIACIPVRD